MDERIARGLEAAWNHWTEYTGEDREEVMENLYEAGRAIFGEIGEISTDPNGSVWFIFGNDRRGVPVFPTELTEKQVDMIVAFAEATIKANAAQPRFFKKDRPAVKRPSWVHPYHPDGWKIVAEKGPQQPKTHEPLVEDE